MTFTELVQDTRQTDRELLEERVSVLEEIMALEARLDLIEAELIRRGHTI